MEEVVAGRYVGTSTSKSSPASIASMCLSRFGEPPHGVLVSCGAPLLQAAIANAKRSAPPSNLPDVARHKLGDQQHPAEDLPALDVGVGRRRLREGKLAVAHDLQ